MDILEISEKNAPSSYKYCLTLVLRETNTFKKVLKNRNLSAKEINPATGAEAANKHGLSIAMYRAVIISGEYKNKISETQKKPATGAKKKRKRVTNQLNHRKIRKSCSNGDLVR